MTEGQGWTLIARVSNNDAINWLPGSSFWKNNMKDPQGNTTDPFDGMDMISRAFWLVGSKEFMITRNDDPHTALLQTTDDCLGGQTFRHKIRTSHSKGVGIGFSANRCRSSCNVRYGGQYETTEGFEQANENRCSPANLQSNNKIGFWCQHENPKGAAIMMIGAGGGKCSADHGIGIRGEAGTQSEEKKDFGNKANGSPTKKYSLNLWVR